MRAEAAPSTLYVPELGAQGSALQLSEAESRYLVQVCRARAGDVVRATDGRGAEALLETLDLEPRVRCRVRHLTRVERARQAWVCCGAPEGQRADWLVEKLAELGVDVWQPLECERGVWTRAAGRRDRWERLAIAALRQSRGRFLMEIRDPVAPEAALNGIPAGARLWLASPEGRAGIAPTAEPGLSVGAIGPSSGFTPAERQVFQSAGFVPLRLAAGRLRSETAALAWALWWQLGS